MRSTLNQTSTVAERPILNCFVKGGGDGVGFRLKKKPSQFNILENEAGLIFWSALPEDLDWDTRIEDVADRGRSTLIGRYKTVSNEHVGGPR